MGEVLYRRATGPDDLLAKVMPVWRRSAGAGVSSFVARHHDQVLQLMAQYLAKLAVRRYMAAPEPPDDDYFVRFRWRQALRFRDVSSARALCNAYKGSTGRYPGAGIEHRAGAYRAEWLSGDDEVSIQGPINRASQRLLLLRYGFGARGCEYFQNLPVGRKKSGRAAATIWTRARHAVDKLAKDM